MSVQHAHRSAVARMIGDRVQSLRVRLVSSVPRAGELTRSLGLMVVAVGLLNASNYLFHMVISRLLGPAAYGGLASLLALFLVLSVPLSVIQAMVAKRVSRMRTAGTLGDIRASVGGAVRTMALPAVGLGVVLLVLSPVLASYLRVGVWSVALIGPYVSLSLILSVPLGALQGALRFRAYAVVAVSGVVLRLGLGVILVSRGSGIAAAVLATVAGQALSLGVALAAFAIGPRGLRRTSPDSSLFRGGASTTLLFLGGFWLLAELDVLLARHYLVGTQSGLYASAGLAARALLFLPGAVATAAFPFFAETDDAGTLHDRFLPISVWATIGLVTAPYAAFVLLRRTVVVVTFGRRFLPAAGLLPVMGAAMALLGVASVLVYYHIAAATRAHLFIYLGVVAEGVLVARFHGSPQTVATSVLVVSASVTALLAHAARAHRRWRPFALRGPGAEIDATERVAVRSGGTTVSVSPEPRLSVVVPCYNAGGNLGETLTQILRAPPPASDLEVIVVSDGSTDGSVRVAEGFAHRGVRVVHYPNRSGKGHALRVGLASARGEYVAFIDADGDISPDSLAAFMEIARLYEPDIVLGSKRHPLSDVAYPPLRRLVSWVYYRVCRVLFRVNVRDTQTGLKMIRRDVLTAVLPWMLEKRFAFDLELLVVAHRLGYRRVFEAPIRIDYRFQSSVKLGSAVRMLLDTLAIFYRRYVLNTYRPGPSARTVTPRRVLTLPGAAGGAALRILFLNWRDIRNPEAGGAEKFTHEVATRWVQAGHEVSLLTSGFPGAARVEVIDGVRVHRIGRLRNGSLYVLAQKELAWLRGFDVVIDEINTLPFLTPLWRRRLPPVVALIHQLAAEVWNAEVPAPLAYLGRRIEPLLLGMYRRTPVVTVSASTRADLLALGLSDVRLVPEGVDRPPDFTDVQKEGVPTLLYVGRLAANKRPEDAVQAFRLVQRSLPQARLWMIGQGPLEERLRRSLPSGADLLGFLPRAEMYRRMGRAHCLLVPSVREGWGLVVSEANSVGTPAVGYDVPGIRDSIRGGVTGLLAEAGDPAALAKQTLTLLSDPEAYRTMARRAAQTARWYSWQSTADELMAVIKELCVREAVPERTARPPRMPTGEADDVHLLSA